MVQLSHLYVITEKSIALKKILKNKGNHKVKRSLFSIDYGCTFQSCMWIATIIWQPGAVLACRQANMLRMVRQKIGKSPCLWWCQWVSKPILELAYFHTSCCLNFLYAKKKNKTTSHISTWLLNNSLIFNKAKKLSYIKWTFFFYFTALWFKHSYRDFLDGPVAKTLCSLRRSTEGILCRGFLVEELRYHIALNI